MYDNCIELIKSKKIKKKLKTPNSTRPKNLTKIIVNKKFEKLTII